VLRQFRWTWKKLFYCSLLSPSLHMSQQFK
jgi:hypothetical protein